MYCTCIVSHVYGQRGSHPKDYQKQFLTNMLKHLFIYLFKCHRPAIPIIACLAVYLARGDVESTGAQIYFLPLINERQHKDDTRALWRTYSTQTKHYYPLIVWHSLNKKFKKSLFILNKWVEMLWVQFIKPNLLSVQTILLLERLKRCRCRPGRWQLGCRSMTTIPGRCLKGKKPQEGVIFISDGQVKSLTPRAIQCTKCTSMQKYMKYRNTWLKYVMW